MKRFDKRVVVGTKVFIFLKWHIVSAVHESRQWIELEGMAGSFQVGHIDRFKN